MAQHVWEHKEEITTDKLNDLENRVEAKAEKGDPGEAGKGVSDIALETTDGKVTGGTVTYTDKSTGSITVTEKPTA